MSTVLPNALAHVSPDHHPRVQLFPSASGTTLIVGVTSAGDWVAEYRCRTCDLSTDDLEAMERRVASHELRPVLVAD